MASFLPRQLVLGAGICDWLIKCGTRNAKLPFRVHPGMCEVGFRRLALAIHRLCVHLAFLSQVRQELFLLEIP